MLTLTEVTTDTTIDNLNAPTVAIELSDAEISRRVLRIRASWSVQERVERRRAAEQRFTDLLSKLTDTEVAA